MLRFLLRLAGYMAMALGFVLLVFDGTRSIANARLDYIGLGELGALVLGSRYAALQPAVERSLHPFVWDPLLTHLLSAPAALVGLGLGFLLLRLGQPSDAGIGMLTRR